MGNPLEWIPEVKKEVFRIFEIFFLKNHGFSVKKMKIDQKWPKNSEKVQKIFQT